MSYLNLTYTEAEYLALLAAVDFQQKTGTALPATTGAMTATMDGGRKAITPTGACTFNATGGVAGYICTFEITTSGASSFVLTFGTNFKSQGTLATGTTTGKRFNITFRYDGANWCEISRTTAM
jgi:hypothetical protein